MSKFESQTVHQPEPPDAEGLRFPDPVMDAIRTARSEEALRRLSLPNSPEITRRLQQIAGTRDNAA